MRRVLRQAHGKNAEGFRTSRPVDILAGFAWWMTDVIG
jgi:hypothetical protein